MGFVWFVCVCVCALSSVVVRCGSLSFVVRCCLLLCCNVLVRIVVRRCLLWLAVVCFNVLSFAGAVRCCLSLFVVINCCSLSVGVVCCGSTLFVVGWCCLS